MMDIVLGILLVVSMGWALWQSELMVESKKNSDKELK